MAGCLSACVEVSGTGRDRQGQLALIFPERYEDVLYGCGTGTVVSARQ